MNDMTRTVVGSTVSVTALLFKGAFTVFDRVTGAARYLVFGAQDAARQANNKARDFANHPDRYERKAERAVENFEDDVVETYKSKKEQAKEFARDKLDIDDPDYRPYEERTKAELYDLAQERNIEGRSTMSKKQLIAALRADRD